MLILDGLRKLIRILFIYSCFWAVIDFSSEISALAAEKNFTRGKISEEGSVVFIDKNINLNYSKTMSKKSMQEVADWGEIFNSLLESRYVIIDKNNKFDIENIEIEYPLLIVESISSPILSLEDGNQKIFSKLEKIRESIFDEMQKNGKIKGVYLQSSIQIVNFSLNRLKCEADLVFPEGGSGGSRAISRDAVILLNIDFNFDEADTGVCILATLSMLLGVELSEDDVNWQYFKLSRNKNNINFSFKEEPLRILKNNIN